MNIITVLSKDNIEKLNIPIDSDGYKCGKDLRVQNKPYVMFTDVQKCLSPWNCETKSVCVEKCPVKSFIFNFDKDKYNDEVKKSMICSIDAEFSTYEKAADLVIKGKCAAFYLDSASIFHRCIPDVTKMENLKKDHAGLIPLWVTKMGVEFDTIAKNVLNFESIHKVTQNVRQDVANAW